MKLMAIKKKDISNNGGVRMVPNLVQTNGTRTPEELALDTPNKDSLGGGRGGCLKDGLFKNCLLTS